MPTTTTYYTTLRDHFHRNNLTYLAEAVSRVRLGDVLAKIKATFTGLSSAAAQDVTTAAAKAAATVGGISLLSGENLPPIGSVISLRVTAGAAAAGPRTVTDAGGTPSATVATLSDDGKTLTFEAAVTGFVIQYHGAPGVPLDTKVPIAEP